MKTMEYYLFEIEVNELPIYEKGEWEDKGSLTVNKEEAAASDVVAYGATRDQKYVELFTKN
ncbi:hypothetical protein UP12_19630 (plasmid) [Bacillus pumilus]|uniref:hypothetical protein n=1 Tax=Bacillus pumilus TaxID=1408 RepID=UPI000776A5B1|nr:hypothetical protein [Bacillus pumilus]AMM99616.1 hypothetical protein UP12_19630 [Bacillus pumilus]